MRNIKGVDSRENLCLVEILVEFLFPSVAVRHDHHDYRSPI